MGEQQHATAPEARRSCDSGSIRKLQGQPTQEGWLRERRGASFRVETGIAREWRCCWNPRAAVSTPHEPPTSKHIDPLDLSAASSRRAVPAQRERLDSIWKELPAPLSKLRRQSQRLFFPRTDACR